MKRDVYPVKVIKILPVQPDGPKPPFLKSPKRLATLYANVCAAAVRVWVGIRAETGRWAERARDAGMLARRATAARYRTTLAHLQQPRRLRSSKETVQRERRAESFGAKALHRANSRIHTMRQRFHRQWPSRALWTAMQTAMALQLRTWRDGLGRMLGLKNGIANQHRLPTHRHPHNEEQHIASTESHDPSRPDPSDRLEPSNVPQKQHVELAELAAELAAVKADVASHKQVIDNLTKKLTAIQSGGAQSPAPALGPTAAPPVPKPPLSTKRNGQGEAKLHRS